MNNQEKISFIQSEYLKLQDIYEDYDKRLLSIKNWSVVSGLSTIVGGFTYKIPYLFLFGSIACLFFWILESIWKKFQYCYAERIVEIESAIRNDSLTEFIPFQIYNVWFEVWKKSSNPYFENFTMTIVMYPHVFGVISGLILFVIYII